MIMILLSSHSPAGMRDHAMGAARGEPSGGAIPMRGAAEPRLLSALRIGGLRENTAENGNKYFRMKGPP